MAVYSLRNRYLAPINSFNMAHKPVKGFSKLSKEAKMEWLNHEYLSNHGAGMDLLKSYWHADKKIQKLHDEFSENTLSNFYVPFGIAPNFLINDDLICLPMAIEESSVVAAAAKAANYWLTRGGFHANVISMTKIGHVHFVYYGDPDKLRRFIESKRDVFLKDTQSITENMRKRGGGITEIELINKTYEEPNYYQLSAKFDTRDSMGANFINSCLEQFAKTLESEIQASDEFTEDEKKITILMCILSNYTPECVVTSEVSCPINELTDNGDISPEMFAKKFEQAIHVARIEPYRATTHNKGIFNGIDAVVIATGNDFRAIEACGHAYAARSGKYRSLTDVEVHDGQFRFYIKTPMALGTVGGITSLHPMVKLSLEILGNPDAEQLMKIVATAGLAQNFSAVRSLVTTGIQRGHMKMHLLNILNQLEATEEEKAKIVEYFKTNTVSFSAVEAAFKKVREGEELNTK